MAIAPESILKDLKDSEEDQKALLRADDESMTQLSKPVKPSPAQEIRRLGKAKRLVTEQIYQRRRTMIQWAITFLIIALIAAVLGFGGVAAISISMARTLFLIFIVLFLVTAVIHLLRGKSPPAL